MAEEGYFSLSSNSYIIHQSLSFQNITEIYWDL